MVEFVVMFSTSSVIDNSIIIIIIIKGIYIAQSR